MTVIASNLMFTSPIKTIAQSPSPLQSEPYLTETSRPINSHSKGWFILTDITKESDCVVRENGQETPCRPGTILQLETVFDQEIIIGQDSSKTLQIEITDLKSSNKAFEMLMSMAAKNFNWPIPVEKNLLSAEHDQQIDSINSANATTCGSYSFRFHSASRNENNVGGIYTNLNLTRYYESGNCDKRSFDSYSQDSEWGIPLYLSHTAYNEWGSFGAYYMEYWVRFYTQNRLPWSMGLFRMEVCDEVVGGFKLLAITVGTKICR